MPLVVTVTAGRLQDLRILGEVGRQLLHMAGELQRGGCSLVPARLVGRGRARAAERLLGIIQAERLPGELMAAGRSIRMLTAEGLLMEG